MAKREKVAIVAFTPHQSKAPWKDDSWELWGLNDLYQTFEQYAGKEIWDSGRVRWFQLHRAEPANNGQIFATGARDPNHLEWLRQAKIPIYCWDAYKEIPASVKYPMLEILSLFPRAYFNNTISWMIALAIAEGYKTIGIYGVDMATDGVPGGGEYSHQRPSCEYFIGIAEGRGIEVILPDDSELCKTPYLYGWDNISYMRSRLHSRLENMELQEAECVNQYEATKRSLHEIRGAKMDVQWMLKNWFPGEGQIQDVVRTPRSVTLAAPVSPEPPASDGKDQPVNRLVGVEA